MNIGDIFELEIEKQDFFGNGIGRINNFLVFVENGLPGDVVLVKIIELKKNYARAIIQDIIVESLDRDNIKCSYYNQCGGCQLLHQKRDKQLLFKENKIKELFLRKQIDVNVLPIIYGESFNYRNKVIFRSNGKDIGLYKENTHEIVPIYKCLLLNKRIQDIYIKLHEFFEVNREYAMTEAMIKTTSIGEVMLSIKGSIDKNLLISVFKNINSLYLNDELILGDLYITEKLFDCSFRIYKDSFFQVNYEMTKELYGLVIDYVKDKKFNNILDLYCGTGTIGMLVSKYVNKVTGIDVVSDSIEAANINKEINNIDNIDFILGKVEDNIDKFNNIDLIIVDPPRSGLDNKTINNIIKILPKSLVYVSCGPDTLIRDLEVLKEKYKIIKVNVVDMFPNTYHVESVVILEKKDK